MIVCPFDDCAEDFDSAEIETRYGITGPRLYINCPKCERPFEIELLVQDPATTRA